MFHSFQILFIIFFSSIAFSILIPVIFIVNNHLLLIFLPKRFMLFHVFNQRVSILHQVSQTARVEKRFHQVVDSVEVFVAVDLAKNMSVAECGQAMTINVDFPLKMNRES